MAGFFRDYPVFSFFLIMSVSLSIAVYMLPTMNKDFQFSIERIYKEGNLISLFTSIFYVGKFNIRGIFSSCLIFLDFYLLDEKFRTKKSELIYIILLIYFLSTLLVLMFALPDLQSIFFNTIAFYSSKVMPYQMIILFTTPTPYYLVPYIKGIIQIWLAPSPPYEFLYIFIEWATASLLFFFVKVFPKFTRNQEILKTPIFLQYLCGECDI